MITSLNELLDDAKRLEEPRVVPAAEDSGEGFVESVKRLQKIQLRAA